MAAWKADMVKKSEKDPGGFARELCKGYMMLGEEIKVAGGLTLDFRAKNVFYYILKAVDHFCYQMVAYRDKKHSKKKDETPVLAMRYTGQVLVHRFVIGQKDNKKEAIFVVIHAQRPTYFKPDQKQADMWFREFHKVAQYSKDKKQSKGAVAHNKTPPINSPERYVPIPDGQFIGEYVSMRSLPGPKKSPEVERPNSQGQLPPGVPTSKPSRLKPGPALGATAKQPGNTTNNPHIKQNALIGQRTSNQGVQKQGRHRHQETNVHIHKGHTDTRTERSPSNTLQINKVLPIRPRSTGSQDDEVSLPSMYAPDEIIFDEMDGNPWDGDVDDGKVDSKPSTRVLPSAPQTRKPVKRGRSLRRLREDGKFVWDIIQTASEEGNTASASQTQARSPHHHAKDTTKQTNVSMKSVTHHRFITSMAGSSVTQTVDRSTVRRRSISDPVDPSALLQSMSNLGRASRLSDGWTIESGSFYRQPERHESSQSSERGSLPIYLQPTALKNTPSGHDKRYNTTGGRGRPSPGLSQTDVTSRNHNKSPIPIPVTVVQSAEMPHFYEELTSVQNSRQLLELLSHEQKIGRICVELKKHDANNGLVFVELKSKIWIASWKKDVNGQAKFQKMLHIGDELLAVNGQEIRDVKHAAELISSSSGDMVWI
eukprot:XP_011665690.1 PREDICTED: uncharacterized protein LOC105438967 [Strongylocentrotus purpuratus]